MSGVSRSMPAAASAAELAYAKCSDALATTTGTSSETRSNSSVVSVSGPALERRVELAAAQPAAALDGGGERRQVVDRGVDGVEAERADVVPRAQQRGGQQVGVRLDEPGQDRGAGTVDDLRVGAGRGADLVLGADRQDAVAADRDRLVRRERRVDRQHRGAADDDGAGGAGGSARRASAEVGGEVEQRPEPGDERAAAAAAAGVGEVGVGQRRRHGPDAIDGRCRVPSLVWLPQLSPSAGVIRVVDVVEAGDRSWLRHTRHRENHPSQSPWARTGARN